MALKSVNRFRGQGLRLSLPAGTAVAGAALAESAQATIQWSGSTGQQNLDLQIVKVYDKATPKLYQARIDVDGDGGDDYQLTSQMTDAVTQEVSISPLDPGTGILNAMAVDKASPKLFENFASVGENENWDFGGSHVLWSNVASGVLGNRQSMANLGLRFTSNGGSETHYAWLQMSTDMQNPDVNNVYQNTQFTIVSWAYEDSPGASIPAGVPEPMSLMIMGTAATVMLTRRGQRRG